MDAVGMIEVFGYVTAVMTADACVKAADIKVVALDSTKPAAGDSAPVPLVMIVKIEGNISAVKAAVEAGVKEAEKHAGVIAKHIIARPDKMTEKMINLNSICRDGLKNNKDNKI